MATRKRSLNKAARIRALLAQGCSTEQILKRVKGAKQKDVYNVTYRQRKEGTLPAAKANPVPKNTLDTKAEHAMTGDEWMRALQGKSDESLPTIGVEITARIVLDTPDQFDLVEEVLEKAREYGSAEVTRQVALRKGG